MHYRALFLGLVAIAACSTQDGDPAEDQVSPARRTGAASPGGSEPNASPTTRPDDDDVGPGVDPALTGVEPRSPLQIALPRAAGSAPEAGAPPIPPSHRIFWAYPGLPYVIRAAVVGGHAPYTYALTGAPSGMTIAASTGVITWANPTISAANITLRVTDRAGAVQQTTWSVTVDAARFVFVAASGATGGNGTAASPYRRIADIPEGPHVGKVVYFRNGTYDLQGLPVDAVGSSWDRVEIDASTRPIAWLAYPGESPEIDFRYAGAAGYVPFLRILGDGAYIEGFTTRRSQIMAFQLGGNHYAVVRKNHMTQHGPGENGTNSAFVMTLRGSGSQASYMAFQDNELDHTIASPAFKFYSQYKLLLEDNVFHDIGNPPAGEGECLALKDSVRAFTVRKNVFYAMGSQVKTIAGNMAADEAPTSGEILRNVVRAGSLDAVDLNQNGLAGMIFLDRNTFVGRVRVRYVDAADGPFTFTKNVIVNDQPGSPAGSHIFHEEVSDPTRIVTSDNLVGTTADGIVDALGALTPAFAAHRGVRGHE